MTGEKKRSIFGDQRKHNKGRNRPKKLSEQLNLFISPKMLKSIEKLVNRGHFPNKSEFVRYVIRNYFDGFHSWSDAFKRIYNNRDEINERIAIMVEQWEIEDSKQ